jgi:hypothetical protein
MWVSGRVEAIVDYQKSKQECACLLSLQRTLQSQRDAVLAELKPLKQRQADAEGKLRLKVTEVEATLRTLQDKHAALAQRQRQASAGGTGAGGKGSQVLLQSQLEEAQFAVESYEDHRAELLERIQRGRFLDEQAQGVYMDLLEELETFDAEIGLNNANILHENLRLAKFAEAMSGGGGGAGAGGGGGMLSDADCLNLLLRDLREQSIMPLRDAATGAKVEMVLTHLIGTLVSHRTQTTDSSASLKLLQQQLDDKNSENEELIKTMQKSRAEAMRRQEQQKREGDEKVAFLLSQLRALEARRLQADDSASASVSVAGASTSHSATNTGARPKSAVSMHGGVGGGMSAARVSVSAGGSRPPSDAALSELVRRGGAVNASTSSTTGSGGGYDINTEVGRRWLAERERRELLEGRNTEMAKELRELRAVAAAATTAGTVPSATRAVEGAPRK